MADMKDFNDINDIYKQFFKTNFPARAAYQVAALPKGAQVEIEAIAVQGPLQDASAWLWIDTDYPTKAELDLILLPYILFLRLAISSYTQLKSVNFIES